MATSVPAVSAEEMAELDRALSVDYRIDLSMLIENAGRSLAAQSAVQIGATEGKRVLVMAGKGSNGGGGMVAARHLHNWGARVELLLSADTPDLKDLTSRQLRTLNCMGIAAARESDADMAEYDLIIDSLLGYNQKDDPRGKVAELVHLTNHSGRPILRLDVPTGLDPDSGHPNNPCIKGSQTLTLALPKKGLLESRAKPYVGALFFADIGVPLSLYRKFGLAQSIFETDTIIRLEV